MSSLDDAGQLAALEVLDDPRGGFVRFHAMVLEYAPHATNSEVQSVYDKYIGRPQSPSSHDPETGEPCRAAVVRYEVPKQVSRRGRAGQLRTT